MYRLFPQKCGDNAGLKKTICLQAFCVCKPCKYSKSGFADKKMGLADSPVTMRRGVLF
jgi:hypothetical protein